MVQSKTRQSADVRREQLIRAAVAEFSQFGLHGTSAEKIARHVQISQPYVFRLFPTKKDLFLAAIDQCFDRVEAAFRVAANDPVGDEPDGDHTHPAATLGNPRLHAMGHAYAGLLSERELLLFQMQAYAACSDEDVRQRVSQRWSGLTKLVSELSGASPQEITVFFAHGMLMNVVVSMGLVPPGAGKQYAHKSLGFA